MKDNDPARGYVAAGYSLGLVVCLSTVVRQDSTVGMFMEAQNARFSLWQQSGSINGGCFPPANILPRILRLAIRDKSVKSFLRGLANRLARARKEEYWVSNSCILSARARATGGIKFRRDT
jgi:hypothetical protein